MSEKVLYFPNIRVPDSVWFTRVLLYWDQVGSIIPIQFIDNPEQLGEHTRSLVETELVAQVFPSAHIWNIPRFNEAFIEYLHSLKGQLERRRIDFASGKVFRIHAEKMDCVSDHLVQMGLATQANTYPWFLVESRTASDFMSYLAAVLGRKGDLQYTPITDHPEHINHFLSASNGETASVIKVQHLRQDILDDLLPSPAHPLTAYQIRQFKDRYGQLLGRFRRHIEMELTSIADISDPLLRHRRLNLFRQGAREDIEEIVARLKESGSQDVVMGKLCSIAAAIPGVHWLAGLAAAVYGASEDNKKGDDRSPLLYAAYAQRDLALSELQE